jgi:hypothetical protein
MKSRRLTAPPKVDPFLMEFWQKIPVVLTENSSARIDGENLHQGTGTDFIFGRDNH